MGIAGPHSLRRGNRQRASGPHPNSSAGGAFKALIERSCHEVQAARSSHSCERQALVHVQSERPVRIHMLPQQGREGPPVGRREPTPYGPKIQMYSI
jgi:hypothetical protein